MMTLKHSENGIEAQGVLPNGTVVGTGYAGTDFAIGRNMNILTQWELYADGEEDLEGLYLRAPGLPDMTNDLARVVQWITDMTNERRETVRA